MHRIDCPTATPDNRFTEGDPTIPVAATTVTADWLNAVQEELAAVIAGAELSLDKTNNAQLLQALHKILDLRAPLATLLRAGLMQPDGVTTTVGEAGLLSALGGNLLLNSKEWLTESGTWVAKSTGWHELFLIGGGAGAYAKVSGSMGNFGGGWSGDYRTFYVYLTEGQEVPVVIGAGGLTDDGTAATREGGLTSFGEYSTVSMLTEGWQGLNAMMLTSLVSNANNQEFILPGSGFGGTNYSAYPAFYGSGGHVRVSSKGTLAEFSTGQPGAICARWHDPAKAAGPPPEPALLSARSMASRTAAAPATVNLYDPETGQGSVWREEDAPAQLAKGRITETAWLEIRAARAAEEYAAWLASPDTEAERFELLRIVCEAKLTATDKLTTADYPISDEDRAVVSAYRKAIRELNHQPGAPWDGGGEATPWPEMPTVSKVQEEE